MVDPLQPVVNFFLGFLSVIPSPIRLLLYVSFGLIAIGIIVKLIFR